MSGDDLEFRRALALSVGAASFVVAIAALLAPIGAISHLHGLFTAMCDTIPHLISDVAALGLFVLVVSFAMAGTATVVASIVLERSITRSWAPTLDQDVRSRVRRVARGSGVASRVIVFRRDDLLACTRGILRRTIWISDACVVDLSDEELLAVLAHEDHHCARRDPMRLQMVTICARSLVAFPAVAAAAARFGRAAEFAADDHARRVAGGRATASALLRFADSRSAPLLAQFGEPASIGERVQRLLGRPEVDTGPRSTRATLLTLMTIVGGVACLAIVAVLPAMA